MKKILIILGKITKIISGDFLITRRTMTTLSALPVIILDFMEVLAVIGTIQAGEIVTYFPLALFSGLVFYTNSTFIKEAKEEFSK